MGWPNQCLGQSNAQMEPRRVSRPVTLLSARTQEEKTVHFYLQHFLAIQISVAGEQYVRCLLKIFNRNPEKDLQYWLLQDFQQILNIRTFKY